jgi:hypothetical protein
MPTNTRAMDDLIKLQYQLTEDRVDSALEMSKRGGHLWNFLAVPLLARKCRIYIYDLTQKLGVPVKGSGLAEGIEVSRSTTSFMRVRSVTQYEDRWGSIAAPNAASGSMAPITPWKHRLHF